MLEDASELTCCSVLYDVCISMKGFLLVFIATVVVLSLRLNVYEVSIFSKIYCLSWWYLLYFDINLISILRRVTDSFIKIAVLPYTFSSYDCFNIVIIIIITFFEFSPLFLSLFFFILSFYSYVLSFLFLLWNKVISWFSRYLTKIFQVYGLCRLRPSRAGFYEYGNEPLNSIKGGDILDQFRKCHLLKNKIVPYHQIVWWMTVVVNRKACGRNLSRRILRYFLIICLGTLRKNFSQDIRSPDQY